MDALISGFDIFFQWSTFLFVGLGVGVGMIMGSIPGLTATMAIALIIPMTFYMPPVAAISMLIGAYKGGCYGGSIPGILLNTPGTPAAAATVIDGFQMAKQGKSMKALKIAIYSSVIADTTSDLVLILVAPPLAIIALKIGPPEMTSLIIFSLMMVTLVAGKSLIKGLIAAGFGLLLGSIGLDPIMATERFSFGTVELQGGLSLIPLLIGLFAVAEFFVHAERKITTGNVKLYERSSKPEDNRVTGSEFKSSLKVIGVGTGIGTFLGAVPGIGPTIAAFISYGQAKRMSKTPEKFGKGEIQGIAAAEAGNNAVAGSNLIPLLTLGIPGDVGAAVLIGAFMLQGLQPGPLLFTEHIDVMYGIFMAMILANAFNFGIATQYIKLANRISDIPRSLIFPGVLVFCFIGSYAINQSMFDVGLTLLFGVLGYIMIRTGFPAAPLLIAFILEPILERAFRQSLLVSQGNFKIFVDKPISLVLLGMTVLALIVLIRSLLKKKPLIAEEA